MKRLVWLVAMVALPAVAGTDVATLYDISTEGSTASLKAGEKGKLVIAISTKEGAHVSDEAPLKIELSSKQAKVEKAKLTLADSVAKKKEGAEYADPRFEVAFTPTAQGKGSVDAKMTFFICTDKVCARQVKELSLALDVK